MQILMLVVNFCITNQVVVYTQGAVAGVVGRINMTERHKIQLALKFFKAKLTEYRSEERRKVCHYNYNVLTKAMVVLLLCRFLVMHHTRHHVLCQPRTLECR